MGGFMVNTDQINKFTQKARASGFSEAQIAAEIARKNQEPTSPVSPQTNAPATTPQAQPQKGSFLSDFVKALVKPAVEYGKQFGEAVGQAGRLLNPEYRNLSSKVRKGTATGSEADQYLQASKPIFMNEKELSEYSTPAKGIKKTIQRAAGGMAYAIPGGVGVSGAVKAGAVAGGLFGLSEGEDIDIKNILYGSAGGAIAGGTLAVAGKATKGLISKVSGKLSSSASKGINKATPSMWQKAVEEHGIDLNKATKELFPRGGTYETALGSITDRGKGGTLGKVLQESEKIIAKEIQGSGGANTKILMDDFVKDLLKESNKLTLIPGNEGNSQALNEFARAFSQKYKNGLTPSQLLNLKRVVDSQFGKAVVDEATGSPIAQAQKALANAARGKLKSLFPKIKDALDKETTIYTLRPVLNRARSISKTPGSTLRLGKMNSLTDLINPFVWMEKVFGNERVASKFLGKTTEGLAEVGKAGITSKIAQLGGAAVGTQLAQPTEPTEPTTPPVDEGVTQKETVANPFGDMTKQQVLMKALSMGATKKDLDEVSAVYDMVAGSQEGVPAGLSATEKAAYISARGAMGLVGILKNKYQQIQAQGLAASGPGVGLAQGIKGTVASTLQTSPEAAAYKNSVDAFLSKLARASGERGVLTDTDLKRIKKAIPGFYITPETAKQQWDLIESIIQDSLSLYE